LSARRPGKGRRPPPGKGRRLPVRRGMPELPEVAIKRAAVRPGSKMRIGKGGQRMVFGHRIIQVEGIPIMKFNLREKRIEED